MKLGIGIITYNRQAQLLETIAAVQANTTLPFALVVADDGSDDDTVALVRERRVTVVSGPNRGVAWNKNRALFLLMGVLRCDVAILLEDDAMPTQPGWVEDWVRAAKLWGHGNLAGAWFADRFLWGVGTVEQPIYSHDVSGQCSVFSSIAIAYAGYLDSRFRGYGFGHVEHSLRLIRLGWGGLPAMAGLERPLFALLQSPITVCHPPRPTTWQADENRNLRICQKLMTDESYRAPWRDDDELRQFRREIASADLVASCGGMG
jgi:glycosyltransferase involved in cell wall biosynthesis